MLVQVLPFNAEIFQQNLTGNFEQIENLTNLFVGGKHIPMRGIPGKFLENLLMANALKKSAGLQQGLLNNYIETSLLKYNIFMKTGQEMTVSYKDESLTFVSEKYEDYVSEIDWTNLFMACLLNRDMQSIRAICEYDLEKIARPKQGVTGGQHSFLFAKFLQHLFGKGVNHTQNLLNAANAINKDSMPDYTYDHALHIYGPVIDMFTGILTKDEVYFNEMLLAALNYHDKFYRKDELVFPNSTTSLWISGVCAMAKDYDLKIEHSSDYLMNDLI